MCLTLHEKKVNASVAEDFMEPYVKKVSKCVSPPSDRQSRHFHHKQSLFTWDFKIKVL